MASTLELLNSIINAFTLGTYPVRPFLLIGYAMFVFLTVWAYPHASRKLALPERMRKHYERVVRIIALAALALLFIIPIVCELTVFHSFGIPQRDLAIFFTGGEITNTRIAHNHFGKTAIAEFLGNNDAGFIQSSDTGAALLPYVPVWVPPLELALFIIALFSSLYIAANAIAGMPNRRKKIWLGALFSLIGFLVLEKSLDGGFVSDGAASAYGAYIVLIYFSAKRFPRAFIYIVLGYVWVLCTLYFSGFYWPQLYLTYALVHTAIFVLAVYALHYGAFGNNKRIKKILVLLVVIVIGIYASIDGQSDRAYLAKRIVPTATYLAVYDFEATPDVPLVGTIGALNIFETASFAGDTIGKITDEYTLPYWYRPLSTGDITCANPVYETEEKFFLLTRTPLHGVPDQPLVHTSFLSAGSAPPGWYRYSAVISFNPCISRPNDVIRETIRLAGSTTTILYGLKTYSLEHPKGEYTDSGDTIR
ncbi:MAG: hypothetical protein JWN49_396 [Parcubacteria group bacterium]|nr:hypothetical protein [Parcubacteria group bacterium]